MEDNRMKRLFISLLLLLTPFALIQGNEKKDRSSFSDASFSAKDLDRLVANLSNYCKEKHPDLGLTIDSIFNQPGWDQVNADIRQNPNNASEIVEALGLHPNHELPYAYYKGKRVSFLGKTVERTIQRSHAFFDSNCPVEAIESLINQGGNPSEKSIPLFEWAENPDEESLTPCQVAESQLAELKKHKEFIRKILKQSIDDDHYILFASDCARKVLKILESRRLFLQGYR